MKHLHYFGIVGCALALACSTETEPTGSSTGGDASSTSSGESTGASSGSDGGTADGGTAAETDSTGDGDGDTDSTTTGDGDGDVNCGLLSREECNTNAQCQPVQGQPIMRTMDGTGGQMLCALASEFVGCIPTTGCGDMPTLWCMAGEMLLTPDTCGPPNWDMCTDVPPGGIAECP